MLNFVNLKLAFFSRYFCLNNSLYYFSLKTSKNALKMIDKAFYIILSYKIIDIKIKLYFLLKKTLKKFWHIKYYYYLCIVIKTKTFINFLKI